MNFKKALFLSLLSAAALLGQNQPAIKIAAQAQWPGISTSPTGNTFIGWVQSDTSFSCDSSCYTAYTGAEQSFISPSGISGYANCPPAIIPGTDNFVILWAYVFMESYAEGSLKNLNGSTINHAAFGRGYTPVGFYSPDTSYSIAWKGYSSGIRANRFYHGAWTGEVTLLDVSTDNIARIAFVPGKDSKILVWTEKIQSQYPIFIQRFSLADQPVGDKIELNNDTTITGMFSFNAAALPDGSTLIAWSGKKDNVWYIFRSVLYSNDSLFTVPVTSADAGILSNAEVAVACNDSGQSVIAYEGKTNPSIQRFDAQGTAIGSSIPLLREAGSAYYPAVSLWQNKIHAAWTEYLSSESSVWYQVFDFNNPFNAVDNQAGTINSMKFELAQNYPNPFNPSTTIRYSIPAFGAVNINVYNVLGKEVATLVNEVKSPGTYSVDFDSMNLPSGIYFYTLKSDTYSITRKMLLLK